MPRKSAKDKEWTGWTESGRALIVRADSLQKAIAKLTLDLGPGEELQGAFADEARLKPSPGSAHVSVLFALMVLPISEAPPS